MKFISSLKELGYLFTIFMILIFFFSPIIAQSDSLNIRTVAVYTVLGTEWYGRAISVELNLENPDIMYLGGFHGFAVTDISDPVDISLISTISRRVIGTGNDMLYNDNTIFYLSGKLYSIDVSNDSIPLILDSIQVTGPKFVLYRNYLLVAGGTTGIYIVDISKPDSLCIVYRDSTQESRAVDCTDSEMYFVDSEAEYVMGERIWKSIIFKYNIRDVTHPIFEDSIHIIHDTIITIPTDLIVEDGIIYYQVPNLYSNCLHFIETEPDLNWINVIPQCHGDYARLMKYNNQLFIIGSGWYSRLAVIDVSDPRDPFEVGFYEKFSNFGTKRDGVMKDSLFFLAAYDNLRVLDISDLGVIKEKKSRTKCNEISFKQIQTFNSIVISAYDSNIDEVKILDLTGKVINRIISKDTKEIFIDLRKYLDMSGVYLVVAKTCDQSASKKVLFIK